MGLDKPNSNDNGKGADIFNDIYGMIREIQGLMKKHILAMCNDPEVRQDAKKFPRDRYTNTTATRIIDGLKRSSESFNRGRENKLFRTAYGGQGNPHNAELYSQFKMNLIANIKEVFPDKMFSEQTEIQRIVENGDDSILRNLKMQINDFTQIKKRTIDEMAKKSRLNDFSKTSDKKAFNDWYDKMEMDLKETFDALFDLIENLHGIKIAMYRKILEIRAEQEVE